MDRDDETENTQTAMRPQVQQRSSIPSFALIIIMLFLLTNHSGDEFLARNHHYDALRSLTYQLSNFTNWMNGSDTNFSMPDRNPSLQPLVESHMTFGSRLDPSSASYFPNITGFIRGETDFYNITLPSLNDTEAPWTSYAQSYMENTNMTEIVNNFGTQDWKATQKMSWSVVDRATVEQGVSDKMAVTHGRIDFVDANSGNEMRLEFEGVHFVSNGSIFGFAEPPGRHVDIRYLPTIVPEESQNETARVVQEELQSRINRIKIMIDNGIVDQEPSEANSGVQSDCGFLVYAQIEPSPVSQEHMDDIESELQLPTGKWTPNVFPLRINGVLLSRECGVLYRFHHAEGLRTQSFLRRVTNYGSVSGIVSLIMLALLIRHVDQTHSPAALQRLSVWTFYTQAIVDAVSLASHITFAILAHGRPSLALITPAFASCIVFSMEAHHATLIYQVQSPGDTPPAPRPPQQPPQNSTADAETAQREQRPQIPSPPAARSFLSALVRNVYSDPQARVWIGILFCLTFVVRAIVSPSLALFFVGSMYSLFWLPQIIRSVRCGRSSSLSAEYLIGMSICRLWFPFYFLANSANVLDVEPRRWVYYLAAFVLLQVGVVLLQKSLGPAFFLPRRFATAQVYDYHPPMSSNMQDPEAPDQPLGDCSICMEVIHVNDSKQLQQVTGGLLQKVGVKRNYSVAPCHHIFHTECLEKWLAVKNICPQCRRPLPPL